MHPLGEVVIHDRRSNTIVFIVGDLSHRKAGDSSLLDGFIEVDVHELTYMKMNFDGRLVKSISVPIDDHFLMCINCDISLFSQLHQAFEIFLQNVSKDRPQSLFNNDWHEALHVSIHTYLNEKKWSFDALDTKKKKSVVHHLYKNGAFKERNAADYIAKILRLGRATVFNYLKEFRNHET